MKYVCTDDGGSRVEAIGAHAGYRVRLEARQDPLSHRFAVGVYLRGSESEEEVQVNEADGIRAESPQDALDLGYERAVAWIDRSDRALT